jgi:hypothetical protein
LGHLVCLIRTIASEPQNHPEGILKAISIKLLTSIRLVQEELQLEATIAAQETELQQINEQLRAMEAGECPPGQICHISSWRLPVNAPLTGSTNDSVLPRFALLV